MSGRCALLVLLLCVSLAACAAWDRPPPQPVAEPDAAERQILVMLRLPPPHFRPDANYLGGYDSALGREAQRRIAQALAGENGLQLIADWPMPALGVDCFVMQLQPARSTGATASLAERLSRDPRVESAQPMNMFHVLGHNDPLYALQPNARLWHLADMHEVATGRNVRVAEIDTGVELDHPDLRGRIRSARNFVDGSPYSGEMHGTAVAGIIAARSDDGIGIAGVAPRAELMALRACWQESGGSNAASCSSFTLAKALQFALDQNAQVINLSLGGPRDRLLERLLDVALARGITIVSAADPQASEGGFPASHAGVLAVAGDEARDARADILLAPARDIPAPIPGGRWSLVAGSSFAAAQVSGVVALLRELTPAISAVQLRHALTPAGNADAVAARPVVVDAWGAITQVAATCACTVTRVAKSSPAH
jgi:subtilase family protein